ncbi:hypothetical protein GH714_018022 [Hevea brasiliensis]|uniref:F-box associated beta-propeller type 1 domain-containing protein n=1 Tax=Hevea brasiliensis TaxID=3981 RepID=A0A6A6N692_HEVBR|nr:hypothetical protein GH714_018022 [Hevea brasiliensis]
MHARWCQFLQQFPFRLKHKFGVQNQVVEALSRHGALLVTLSHEIMGFEQLKGLYANDKDFGEKWDNGKSVAARPIVEQVVEVHKEVKLKLEEASKKYKEVTDKHKRKQVFEVGDKVMVFLRRERKSLRLPEPNVTFETHGSYHPYVGFGFDSHTNDYKVLRIAEFNNNEMPMIEVYSLIAGSWKFLPTTRQKYNIVQKCKQAFVNGVVHFIAFQEDEHGDTETMYVPGFDFSDEVFCEFMLPEESYSPIQCSLWEMKKYGDLESWTKLFAKQGEAVPRALGLSKSGELLLDFYRSSTKGIVSYDAEKQQSKSINIHNKRGDHFLCTYVESLALLDKP